MWWTTLSQAFALLTGIVLLGSLVEAHSRRWAASAKKMGDKLVVLGTVGSTTMLLTWSIWHFYAGPLVNRVLGIQQWFQVKTGGALGVLIVAREDGLIHWSLIALAVGMLLGVKSFYRLVSPNAWSSGAESAECRGNPASS
jgi:hypothetical protein